MKRNILLVVMTLFCVNIAVAQNQPLFKLKANAVALGEFSGDKPTFTKRKAVNADIYFYEGLIKIQNEIEASFKLRNKKEFTNDKSVAFRYDATDDAGQDCVVMLEMHSDVTLLNIFNEKDNIYMRWYILKSN